MAAILVDAYGNELTCASDEAVKCYNEVMEGFMSAIGNIVQPLKRAIKLDTNFILARCLMVHILTVD